MGGELQCYQVTERNFETFWEIFMTKAKKRRGSHHTWPKSVVALLVLLLGFLGLGAKLSFSQEDSALLSTLNHRAERIYRFDRAVHPLPSNRIYALSLALNFGDRAGAEKIVQELEAQLH